MNIIQTTTALAQFVTSRSDVHGFDHEGLISYRPVIAKQAIDMEFGEDVTNHLFNLGLITISLCGTDVAISDSGLFVLAAMMLAAGAIPEAAMAQPDPSVDLPF
jgi:hypothetical protein